MRATCVPCFSEDRRTARLVPCLPCRKQLAYCKEQANYTLLPDIERLGINGTLQDSSTEGVRAVPLVHVVNITMALQTRSVELTEGWTFKQTGTETWYPVRRVPTNVHLDLLDNHV